MACRTRTKAAVTALIARASMSSTQGVGEAQA
jgi:hypothetical protein